MSHVENKRQWEELGQLDPFWAMTGTNRFGAWDLEEFLKTGDDQVKGVIEDAAAHGYPGAYGSILDYGCGVGRLTRAFRSHFSDYVGLDIAGSLIEKAKEIHAERSNVFFDVGTEEKLQDFSSDHFDMVYSWGVLQHIEDRSRVRALLNEWVRILRKDGLLLFSVMHDIHILYRLQPRRRVYSVLRNLGLSHDFLYNRMKLYPQQAHSIPESEIRAVLERAGARVLEVRSAVPDDHPHQIRVFYVTKS